MRFDWRVEGGEVLARKLNALPDGPKRVAPAALKKAGEPIRATASVRAPVGPTGKLSKSMRIQTIPASKSGRDPERDFAVKIGPSRDAWYGHLVERGTVKMRPQPFLRPAFDQHVGGALGVLGRELWAAVKAEAEKDTGTVGGRFL